MLRDNVVFERILKNLSRCTERSLQEQDQLSQRQNVSTEPWEGKIATDFASGFSEF